MPKAILTLLLMAAAVHAKKSDEGSYYTYGQLGVKKKVVSASKIEIIFAPVQEQFYWCPGIKIQETKKGTIVTFVRCKTSKTCAIDGKAKIGRKMIRSVTINLRGKDVFVRNGEKKYKRIYQLKKDNRKKVASHTIENSFATRLADDRPVITFARRDESADDFSLDESLSLP